MGDSAERQPGTSDGGDAKDDDTPEGSGLVDSSIVDWAKKQTWHTTIIRKTCIQQLLQELPRQHRVNALLFQHGADGEEATHVHIVFSGSEASRQRTLNSIFKILSNITESHKSQARASTQSVRFFERFMVYLIRKHCHWDIIGQKFGRLREWITSLQDMSEDYNGSCTIQQFLREDRAVMRHGGQTSSNTMKRQFLDGLLEKYPDATDLRHLKNSLCGEDWNNLYDHFGPWQNAHLSTAWRKRTRENTAFVTGMSFIEWHKHRLNQHIAEIPHLSDAHEFFKTWFEMQRIEPVMFFACICLIADKKLHKKNALLLKGVSNSGKSLMLRLLFETYPVALLGRSGETSSFHLQPLLDHPIAIFEESRITPGTIDDMKLVFGGETLDINVKGSAHETLSRRPCFLSCNHSLTTMCTGEDIVALQNRMIVFHCGVSLCTQLPFTLTQVHLLSYLQNIVGFPLIEAKYADIVQDYSLLPNTRI